MAYTSSYRQKTTGQKAKSFLKKLALSSAFAASVAGIGYHHFGTTEYVTANVLSGDGTKFATDRGLFSNEPSWLHLKGDTETRGLELKLRKLVDAGQKIQFKVYGVHPTVFGQDLNRLLNLPRNITGIEKAPDQPDTPASPFVPPLIPAPAEKNPVRENIEEPHLWKGCVTAADTQGIAKGLPQLWRDFTAMRALPITGKPVYDLLTNPENEITVCVASDMAPNLSGQYQSETKTLSLLYKSGAGTTLHESLHVAQDMREKEYDFTALTVRDYVFKDLLGEAVAVAYELAARQEAENNNVSLRYASKRSASTNAAVQSAFSYAYQQSLQKNNSVEKALSEGGKNVVRHLLGSLDWDWKAGYSKQAIDNTNLNISNLNLENNAAGYRAFRNAYFLRTGGISPKINFVPEEFLGQEADAYINGSIKEFGIKISSAKPATPKFG